MARHLEQALDRLKKALTDLAAVVEKQTTSALIAVENRDPERASAVVEGDRVVDELEIEIEEYCLQILALHQPVAFDLRFVVSVLKINNDLERIGDIAVNLAERAIHLQKLSGPVEPLNLSNMSNQVMAMFRDALECVFENNVDLARSVCDRDAEIDRQHLSHFGLVEQLILKDPEHSSFTIQYLSLSRYLERIADLATNIAEDVIYLVEGNIVRHRDRQKLINSPNSGR